MAELDVAIVGGGPVGLGLAIDLAQRGIRVQVLERSNQLHQIPKGQNLTQRSGEHFRAWGITNAVRDATPIPREYGNAGLVTYGTLLGDYSYDWFQRSKVGAYYFALNERLPQYRLEQVMRDRVNDLRNVHFQTGSMVTGLTQNQDDVTVTYQHDGTTKHITASHVVGCDGARSAVRELAGISQAIDHKGPRMALLVFRSIELDQLLSRYPGKSIYNIMNPDLDGYWQFLGRTDLDGGWFYHVPVPDDATPENYDFKAHLHGMVGQEFALEFDHIGFWDLRISHARTYRTGRVFIAGDAAHSHPPYGGYGVNTGLEDARNLSWKLAAQVEGWGSEALLDSYSSERHPVFKSVSQDFIERMIVDFREFMSSFSPDKDTAAFDAAWKARTEADDSDVTEFLPHYAGSPLVWGEAGAVCGAKGVHEFKARAGYHLSPPPDDLGDLDDLDIWEQLRPGFTLLDLTGDGSQSRIWGQAADALGIPLRWVSLPNEQVKKAYDAEKILVRPDQFIAWTDSGCGDQSGGQSGGKQLTPKDILARAIGQPHQA
ncbi:MAG: FAD-dependent oxidoreductase [Rhizobiaceae bacterium]